MVSLNVPLMHVVRYSDIRPLYLAILHGSMLEYQPEQQSQFCEDIRIMFGHMVFCHTQYDLIEVQKPT